MMIYLKTRQGTFCPYCNSVNGFTDPIHGTNLDCQDWSMGIHKAGQASQIIIDSYELKDEPEMK
jgi:hypothetical protein